MQKDDFIRIQHMLEAAQEAVAFAEGRSRADLATRPSASAVSTRVQLFLETLVPSLYLRLC